VNRAAGKRWILDRAVDALSLSAGWALLGLSALVGVEVVLRKLFTHSLKGVDEMGGYVLAIASVFAFVYALTTHAHIRVDLALKYFGPKLRAALHFTAYALLAAVANLLAWRCVAVWLKSLALGATAATPLGVPLVYPQGIWAVGALGFALVSTWYAVDVALTLARKGPDRVEERFRADRLNDEIRAEQLDVARRSGEGCA
jgi:TRAP-type C4-dicarboxylate transport system permease small subunit